MSLTRRMRTTSIKYASSNKYHVWNDFMIKVVKWFKLKYIGQLSEDILKKMGQTVKLGDQTTLKEIIKVKP